MFDKDFYPTPRNIIAKMLEGLNLQKTTAILEPSAGKGDILDFILDTNLSGYTYETQKERAKLEWLERIYTIEKNKDLQGILRSKGYAVIDSDFLNYVPERNYNLIVMNPPFNQGVKHLLKAIEISNGAEIRCLLPLSVFDNDWSQERKNLSKQIKQRYGTVEQLGKCFADAERRTVVDIVLVRIPEQERSFKFQFNGAVYGEKLHKVSEIAGGQVESTDVFQSMIHRFNMIKQAGQKIYEGLNEAAFYASGFISTDIQAIIGNSGGCGDDAYSKFMGSIRQMAWKSIFDQTKLAGLVTSDIRKDLEDSQNQLGRMAFTYENLHSLMTDLYLSLGDIRKQCIMGAFDLLTRFSADNKYHPEGWKTNDAWMVKKRCIIPYGNKDSESWVKKFPDSKPGVGHNCRHHIMDIEKALCFVAGKEYEKVKEKTLGWNGYFEAFGIWYDTEFFRVKFFKKGTIHLEFVDDNLWKKFNIEACDGKNWLPSDYGRSWQK